jgi:hypothetical protein
VNVSSGLVFAGEIEPSSAEAEPTTIVVALELSAEVSVVSWEVEEYLRTVMD